MPEAAAMHSLAPWPWRCCVLLHGPIARRIRVHGLQGASLIQNGDGAPLDAVVQIRYGDTGLLRAVHILYRGKELRSQRLRGPAWCHP